MGKDEYVWVYTWRKLRKGDVIELQGCGEREGKVYKAEAIKTWKEHVKEHPERYKNPPEDDARGDYWLFRLFGLD